MLMLNRHRQSGALGGYIIAILVFGSMLTMGSRLIPLYMDHNAMSNIMDSMVDENDLGLKTDSQLIDVMKKRFKLNNIRDFPIHEHVEIKRSSRGTDVVLDYEVRMPLISNLDLIASFNKEIELRD